jgi:hypothetical protein
MAGERGNSQASAIWPGVAPWLWAIRDAGGPAPGHMAFMARGYREPERLAQAWGTPFASWDELRSAGFVLPPASFDNPAVIRDLAVFTRRFAEAYFRAVAEHDRASNTGARCS